MSKMARKALKVHHHVRKSQCLPVSFLNKLNLGHERTTVSGEENYITSRVFVIEKTNTAYPYFGNRCGLGTPAYTSIMM